MLGAVQQCDEAMAPVMLSMVWKQLARVTACGLAMGNVLRALARCA